MASIKFISMLLKCSNCKVENRVLISASTKQRLKCGKCKSYLFDYELVCGYLYVLSNKTMPGLVKIGFTDKSVQTRVRELSASTGVPAGFEVEAFFGSSKPQEDEMLIHKTFSGYRKPGKEFFALSAESAISQITGALTRAC